MNEIIEYMQSYYHVIIWLGWLASLFIALKLNKVTRIAYAFTVMGVTFDRIKLGKLDPSKKIEFDDLKHYNKNNISFFLKNYDKGLALSITVILFEILKFIIICLNLFLFYKGVS